jgi:beta-N-acetylhexosaminidase
MNTPSLEQQIGQLFLIGFTGASVTENHQIVTDIRRGNLGGVILFDQHLARNSYQNNIISPGQLEKLTSTLQENAQQPLLIAVDQEGGRVNRFKKELGFPQTPSAGNLGAAEGLQATRDAARQTAEMLGELGINCNLAPVADLNTNPDNPIIGRFSRSFSEQPATVTHHCATWIKEHRRAGVLSCLKHFPGHGSSQVDSHLGFVDITETWREAELQPYKNLIEQGLTDAIMTGHLFNSRLDEENPATLSEKTLTGLLRQRLGFGGVIISDDMQMKAITTRYGFSDACCRAVAAGIDLLIIGNNLHNSPQIFESTRKALLRAVDDGNLSEQRITDAWLRIQQLKSQLRKRQ